MLKTCNVDDVLSVIENSPEGDNTKFLKAAHNLWFRFKNYDKNPPWALYQEGKPVALVFATFSKRSKYINLYEIVTVQGEEGKGYASEIWSGVMREAYDAGMKRLKISCTPSSVSWHKRNGLIFWAVDPSGSLRSDQPLFRTREEQLTFRELAVKDPSFALPDTKVIDQFKREDIENHGFGKVKTERVETAIETVGEYWLRPALFNSSSLESFF